MRCKCQWPQFHNHRRKDAAEYSYPCMSNLRPFEHGVVVGLYGASKVSTGLSKNYRRSTTAEALAVLLSRYGDVFAPAERNEVNAAIAALLRLQAIEEASMLPEYPETWSGFGGFVSIDKKDYDALHLHAQHLASKGK